MHALAVADSGPGVNVLSSRISSRTLWSVLLLAAANCGVLFAGSEDADSDEVPSAVYEASDQVFLNKSSNFLTSVIKESFACLEISVSAKYLE